MAGHDADGRAQRRPRPPGRAAALEPRATGEGVRLDRRNQLVDIRRAWDQGDPDGLGRSITDVNEYSSDLLAAKQTLEETLAVVELVGSARAVELARQWVLVLGQRRVKGEEGLFGDPAQVEEEDYRDPFVALIREELGVDD